MLPVLTLLSVLLILVSLITLIPHPFWFFRIFEYPRLQKLVLILAVIAGWLAVWSRMQTPHHILFVLLAGSAVFHAAGILPYTSLWRKEIKGGGATGSKTGVRVFSANVLQENTHYDLMLAQIRETDPDIVYLLETDDKWEKAMRPLQNDYPHVLLQPQDNTYGLLFFTRLKIISGEVVRLVKEDIPSIQAVLELSCGQRVKVWGLHPEPPVPGESLHSTAKDKELMKVALQAKDEQLPCIIFGDLNDVAWSHTTRLFRKTSGLLDPRIGRGFYSTFSAHHWWIRFPLDYIFCSADFSLANMKRLSKNGSDHFATFVHLVHQPKLENIQHAPEASREDIEEAKELAARPLPPE